MENNCFFLQFLGRKTWQQPTAEHNYFEVVYCDSKNSLTYNKAGRERVWVCGCVCAGVCVYVLYVCPQPGGLNVCSLLLSCPLVMLSQTCCRRDTSRSNHCDLLCFSAPLPFIIPSFSSHPPICPSLISSELPPALAFTPLFPCSTFGFVFYSSDHLLSLYIFTSLIFFLPPFSLSASSFSVTHHV